MTKLNWDHTMINIKDLATATEILKEKGITFKAGGEHKRWGTGNALGYFGLNYIELITVADEKVARTVKRTDGAAVYDAIQDYFADVQRLNTIAVRSDDIEETHRRLKEQGVAVGPIEEGQRLDPQGKLISWKIFFVNDHLAQDLPYPFFIQWKGDDASRFDNLSKQGLIVKHPGGDLRVFAANFEVIEPQAIAAKWGDLLQLPVITEDNGSALLKFNERQLKFTQGTLNHLVSLDFTGAEQELQGQTIKIDKVTFNF
ncbi:hypothetical protein JCM15457_2032 [Liquorilactobacillus sucicola DSM 21376 = JCM 15457]|uniref:Glyoxalase-like domain-containing protein n=1 Tax=Liquorilactobacillus sucicola DSM 21376 = JCM 15457 TaxID=1423806 RepID=A0A023CYT7_9LACO|nr:VOC family protein [Liquorilactobacillus sucicola]KRN06792.1 hypothetical protein FD15_GL000349 [Liquorilactobacillus sucicola DSM 21376 = JCM 15457]GAJ27073.1 hypothetical protein JCM15457_2032 [Liquorilactobacillus sucicola DSM 21376 = JCM 15457]